MIKRCISKEWKFADFPVVGSFFDVDLPHDYCISKERDKNEDDLMGYFPVSSGKYVKFMQFDKGRHYILDVDGAYALSEVSVNEELLFLHPHGYTPYLVDLTEKIIHGINNKLVITTNPLKYSTRWYSGCGLIRDVFLWEGGAVRIEPRDMFIYTKRIEGGSASIGLKYTVTSDISCDMTMKLRISERGGRAVSELSVSHSVKTGKNDFDFDFDIEDALLWDTETPNLYTLEAEIYAGEELTDTSTFDFGIRTVSADVKHGLLLNGKSMKLRGGCIHHDHGGIGAVALPAAEERKIKLLKDAGFNAVRISHNPPSLALLEVCDRLGMIVMDEAFDVWSKRKVAVSDYHIFFREWWQRDIAYMVLRDRNHPSVISYSTGNEIYEIDGTSDAYEWSRKLADEIRRYDDTKLVTSAVQKLTLCNYRPEEIDPEDYKEYMDNIRGRRDPHLINKLTRPFEEPLDIVGLNYYHDFFDIFHEDNPDKVIWGSENWTFEFYDYWKHVTDNSHNIGDFTWTAIDNLGEVGHGLYYWESEKEYRSKVEYPWRSCFQGDLDLCGHRRPQSYFREAVWFGGETPRIFVTHPKHYHEEYYGTDWHFYDVNECWTFPDEYVGRPITVETYIQADTVKWLINGREVGVTQPEKAIARLDTIYEKGEITAVAYKEGRELSRYTLKTAGKAERVILNAEKEKITADNRDLLYVNIALTDKDGNLIADAKAPIECSVTGGELMSVFSGSYYSEDSFTGAHCHTYKGRALAVIRTDKPGAITVEVSSPGLTSGTVGCIAR